MQPFDLVIRGGTVATASDVMACDVGIRGGRIVALGEGLEGGARDIDAKGKLVLPGGVDTHCHIEQLSGFGLMNSDTFESATRAAAFGGTTTVIPFAAQHGGMDLKTVVADYHMLAEKGALIDYAFHMIIADPHEATIAAIPDLVAAGHGSIKVFMTYDKMRLHDEQLLDVLMAARQSGAMVCVHAENHGIITWMVNRLIERGYTAPKYHAVSHARLSEAEAFTRLIAFSELIDHPVMIFHVSTAEGVEVIRHARGRGVKVWGETCPQYLFFTADTLDKPGFDGGKWCFSPPARSVADQEALWHGLANGDLQTVSSDHAPYRFDETGKFFFSKEPNFKQIPNGVGGLQWRLPLLFNEMVSKRRMDVNAFVRLTATDAAKLYNLAPRKGSIAIGADADIAVWDPKRQVTLSDDLGRDETGYNAYAGITVKGWPETVILRGDVIVENDHLKAKPGSGRFLPRGGGQAAKPTGRLAPEMDPARNFGAELY